MRKQARVQASLLCLAAGLLLGGGLGWILGAPSPSPPTIVEQPDQLAARDEPFAAQPDSAEAVEPAAGRAPPYEAPVAPALPRTTGEIWGTVWLSNGAPLADVRVVAAPRVPRAGRGASDSEVAAARLAVLSGRRVARSGADGRYRIEGLDAGLLYRLEASLPGHDVQAALWQPSFFPVGAEVDFVAKLAELLELDLRLPDGSRPERAQVGIQDDAEMVRSTINWFWTPGQPSRAFEPGRWRLQIRAGRDNEFAAPPVRFSVTAGEAPAPITVQLSATPGISGIVRMPPGALGLQPTVELLRETESGFQHVRFQQPSRTSNPQRLWVHAGVAGFQFNDLAPGGYRIALFVSERLVEHRDVAISLEPVRVEFKAPEPRIDDHIVARVLGPEGPLADGVTFSIAISGGGTNSTSSVFPAIRGNGEYWMPRPVSPEPRASYALQVTAGELGTRTTPFDPVQDREIVIEFSHAASLSVGVDGLDPYRERMALRLSVWRVVDGELRFLGAHEFQIGGAESSLWRTTSLEPGEYVVAVIGDAHSTARGLVLARQQLRLEEGDNPLTLTVPPPHAFELMVPQQYRGDLHAIRHVEQPDFRMRLWHIDSDGICRIENLIPGTYEILGHRSGQMRIEIPAMADRRVEFDPKPFTTIKLVPGSTGVSVDGELRVGDVLVSANGAGVESAEHARELFGNIRRRQEAVWVVQREGRLVTVKATWQALIAFMPEPARLD